MNKTLIEQVLKERNMSKMQWSMKAGVSHSDFYQAWNGKKSFFPKWKKALSTTLGIDEKALFPPEEEEEGN